ncbi:Pantothenate:Na+ symporter [Klebsiella pneumoniae]|uniref:Pantothenate:Na+ symporter n=1 Tax=Klebsiella pneumoniae TaxID=573 RepID=A0A378FWI5_KLEPN|nr:Pantothenate:Na+ symporter [Klebsiella pneumoniae]
MDSDWLAFWGNPCIPAVLTSLVASVVVTLLTPASSMSREQALEMITRERESRPQRRRRCRLANVIPHAGKGQS